MDDERNRHRSAASTAAPHSPSSAAKLNDSLIAARVTTLLSHYWTAAEDERLRALQISDWLDDMGDFPAAIVAESCLIWRRSEPNRRPTPGAIRQLCLEAMPGPRPTPSAVLQIEQVEHSPDTVRGNWGSISFHLLTPAEKALFLENMPKRHAEPERPAEPRPQLSDFKTQPYPDQEGLAKEAVAALARRHRGEVA